MPSVVVPDTIEEIDTGNKSRVEKIPPYKVIFLNDDTTSMEFVVHVLVTIFKKSQETAFLLMMEVHHQGAAVVDVLSFEEAEHRQSQVHTMAGREGFPLRCLVEPA